MYRYVSSIATVTILPSRLPTYSYQQHDTFEQVTAHLNQDLYYILTQNGMF